MKLNKLLLSSAALVAASTLAHAASDSWNTTSSGSWVTTTNWASATQAPGSTTTDNTDVATFSNTLLAACTVTVDAQRYIGGISFGNTSGFGYTLSGGALNLNNGGVIQTLAANGAHTDTISSAIKISGTGAATASFTAGATSATSLLSIGAVTGSATTGNTTTLTLNGANTGANAITGIIGDGAGGGKLAIAKSGAGLWVLSGANTYSGGTMLSAGTLRVQTSNAALGTGTLTLDGGTLACGTTNLNLANAVNVTSASSITATNNLILSGNITGSAALTKNAGGNALFLSGNNSGYSGAISGDNIQFTAATAGSAAAAWTSTGGIGLLGNLTSAGTIHLGSLSGIAGTFVGTQSASALNTFSIGALGTDTTFAGTLRNTYTTGTGITAITKVGGGTLTLSGANIYYTGATTITGGTLRLSNVGADIFVSAINVGANTLELNATSSVVDNMRLATGAITGTGTITKTGTGWAMYVGTTVMKDFAGTVDIQAGTFGSGQATGTLGKDGSTMTVHVGANDAAGLASVFDLRGAGVNAAKIDKLTGFGTVGTTHNVASTLTVGTANGSSQFDGNIKGDGSSGNNTPSNPNNAVISLVKVGTGTFTLTGVNTYTGTTTVSGGTVQFAKKASLYNGNTGNWTAAKINVANGATLALNVGGTGEFASADVNSLLTSISTASSATTGLQAGAKIAFDTTNATGGTFTQGNAIANSIGANGGAISLIKLGANTLVLDKANTYSGGTTVNAGTLTAGSDTAFGTSLVTVNGGTLDVGGRTLGNAITLSGGALAGNGTLNGTLTATNLSTATNLTLGGNNALTGTTTVTAGTTTVTNVNAFGSGAVRVNGGTLALGSTAITQGAIALDSGTLTGSAYAGTVNIGGNSAISGTFANIQTGMNASRAINTTGGLSVSTLGGQGTFSGDRVIVTGAHTPGNSPGTQQFDNGLAYDTTAILTMELTDLGGAHDMIIVNGGLEVLSGAKLELVQYGSFDYTNSFWNGNRSFTLITTDGITGDGFTFDVTGMGGVGEGIWSLNQVNNDITATWTATAVPEPSEYGLIGAGALAAVAFVRRRRKHAGKIAA